MRKTVTRYCKTCATCQRFKARTIKPRGSIFPLPTATGHGEIISSIYFINGFLIVDGFDCITTFVDSFAKQAHFIPFTKQAHSIHINATQLSHFFLDNIHRQHGLCRTIISDRDPRFTSTFW
jgi:hypothetical protein